MIIKPTKKCHIIGFINTQIAGNGTRTRTSRAEVCYATPTTSYPHVIARYTLSVATYKKIKNKIKSFFKKNGCLKSSISSDNLILNINNVKICQPLFLLGRIKFFSINLDNFLFFKILNLK